MDPASNPSGRRRGSISDLIRPKKARKDQSDKSASSSVTGSELGLDPLELRRTSTEGQSAFGKLKERVRSRDGGRSRRDSTGRRLSAILPGSRRRSLLPSGEVSQEVSPSRPATSTNLFGTSRSEDSLGHSASISSSLLTEDEDTGQTGQ